VARAAAAAKAADVVQQGGMETTSNQVDEKALAAAKVVKAMTAGDMAGALTAASTLDPKVAMALLTALAAQEAMTNGLANKPVEQGGQQQEQAQPQPAQQ
jgi:hypothetical protein